MSDKEKVNTKGAAGTGDQPTLLVAIEQNFPEDERILQDHLAPRLYRGSDRFWINITKNKGVRNWLVNFTEKTLSGGWSAFLVRKRYIDDRLIESVEEGNIKAVVNLGAGFDTRLYRLPELREVQAWEVDQAEIIQSKRKALQKVLHEFPTNIHLVKVNFMEDDLKAVLNHQGYREEEKTFFIWEAVTQYLDNSAVNKTFAFMNRVPAGSRLVFTYVPKDFITGENLYGLEKFHKRTVIRGRLWHFGLDVDQVGLFLQKHGWKLIEDLGYDDLGERYVKPTGRNLGAMEIERMVLAEKI